MKINYRVLLLALLLVVPGQAQDGPDRNPLPKQVEKLRQSILGDSSSLVMSVVSVNGVDPETLEKRERFKKALLELHALHGPGGTGPRLDCHALYLAIAGEDGGLLGAERRDFTAGVLEKDGDNAGLVALIDGIGPDLVGLSSLTVPVIGAGALDLATPEFNEVDVPTLVWALRQRGLVKDGMAAEALDLLFARCAVAFGSVDLARKRVLEIGTKPAAEGQGAAALKLSAGNVHLATEGRATRSTWPDAAGERQDFRRLWHALEREDLRIDSEGQRRALAMLGRVMPAIPGLLARARGEASTRPVGLKDDEGGRLLGDWIAQDPAAGAADPWAKRLALLKRGTGEERLALIDLIFDFGLVGPELVEPLSDVARGSKDWKLRSMALRALAFQRPTAFDKRIARLGNDKVWQVRLALAECLGAFRFRESVDELLDILGDEHLRVRATAASSLADLTGVALGTSAKRWKTWLAEKGPDWNLPDAAAARTMRAGAPDDERYARYFDLVIPSSHVVFVLDKSESMYWGLWDGAVAQVSNFLSESGPTTFFGLVEYDDAARVFKKGLMGANGANTKKALSFLTRSKPSGATNIVDALRAAWEFNDCDSVVLLSDGLPNRGKPSVPVGIIDAIEKINRYDRIALHTVQMLQGRVIAHDAPADAEKAALPPEEDARRADLRRRAGTDELGGFLKTLARRNEGNFGLGFGDIRTAPPGTRFGPGTDK